MPDRAIAVPEKCRVCGCTEFAPCQLVVVGHDDQGQADPILQPCGWVDFDHTLCSNLRCVAEIPLDVLMDMPVMR
jgi:hypothetical protein